MMIIPRSFQMLGRKISVRPLPSFPLHEYNGLCSPDSNLVHFHPDLDRQTAEHKFLHEVVHMAFSFMGERELYEDERIVDCLAGLLHQFLTTQKGQQ